MTESHMIELWEYGSDRKPPAPATSFIGNDEFLLWLARISSGSQSRTLIWIGIAMVALVCVFAFSILDDNRADFCGPNPLRSCERFYFSVWLCSLTFIPASLSLYWLGWKAKHRPWVYGYAISNKRAFFWDERDVEKFQSVDLDRHPARQGTFGSVAFGKSREKALVFARLERRVAERAIYWATVGRINHAAHLSTTP